MIRQAADFVRFPSLSYTDLKKAVKEKDVGEVRNGLSHPLNITDELLNVCARR